MDPQTSEASAKAGPGVHCGEHLQNSHVSLREQRLRRRFRLTPDLARLIAELAWGMGR